MGRSPCCEKVGLKKGPWTPEEDQKLMAYIEAHGHGSWRALPAKAGLQRCGKSCRLRWTNYLRPDIKRGKFSLQEEQTIIQLHALLGNRWSAIAAHLPKRTDNEIKNYWNTHLKKRLTRMGIDPVTHKPQADVLGGSGSGQSKDASNLSHMAQWESARLEAEARLVRESKLQVQNQLGSSSPQPARLVLNKIPAQPSLPHCLDVLKAWQSSWSKSPPSKDINRMHNMYAMMLATDDLESPTSTLSFPESMLPIPTNVGLINENLLPPPINTTAAAVEFTKGPNSSCEDAGINIIKEASDDNESWRYLTKEDSEGDKRMDHNTMTSLQDDNIMVAVEAFRGNAYETVPVISDNSVMEGLNNDHALVYDSNENLGEENLGIMNGDIGISSCNVNFEENKHYWNSILNLVNDSLSGSPVF